MKKLSVFVLCLMLLASLALPAFAADASSTTTQPTTAPSSTSSTEAVEDEKEEKDTPALSFTPSRFVEMLPKMGVGMLVIFIVIGVIVLTTMLVNKLFSKKKD